MVNKKLCRRCVYRGDRAPHGIHCCYCLVTGRCRTTQPGTQLTSVCPMFKAGPALMAGQRLPECLVDYGEKKTALKKRKEPVRKTTLDKLSDHFRVLYMAGKNDREIAHLTGTYRERVCRWRQLHRLPPNNSTGRKKTRKEGSDDPSGDQV